MSIRKFIIILCAFNLFALSVSASQTTTNTECSTEDIARAEELYHILLNLRKQRKKIANKIYDCELIKEQPNYIELFGIELSPEEERYLAKCQDENYVDSLKDLLRQIDQRIQEILEEIEDLSGVCLTPEQRIRSGPYGPDVYTELAPHKVMSVKKQLGIQ